MQLLECVPNISEGRNPAVIAALAESISATPGVKLLHTDIGKAANRTVFTFAGDPESVLKAAFALYDQAYQLIDMSMHQGTHPRQGAIDVCPFIPLEGMTMNDVIDIVARLAFRLETELDIPGYFYGFNAAWPERTSLSNLRKGQYESLPEKFSELPPDFGNADNWKRFGVTTLGARNLMVAYNVNLDTRDVDIARKIAGQIRESGYVETDADGNKKRVQGRLSGVKAIGWYIEDFDKVQVSCNLMDLSQNGMLEVFKAVSEEAEKLGTTVSGSELVGLAPLSEFTKATSSGPGSSNPISDTVDALGLGELRAFDPESRIIEKLVY